MSGRGVTRAMAVGLCAAALLAILLGGAPAHASEVERRLEYVQRLIEKSSGAERVMASGAAPALAARDKARALLDRARKAHAGGDVAGAGALLDGATRSMFEAVRLAGPAESLARRKDDDFDSRHNSVSVLLDALQRIGAEKGSKGAIEQVVASVRARVGEADALRAAGKRDEARAALDGAYDEAKRAIEDLRGGETLVRSLSFATKEEEYRYELDRNDTHRMLVDVLTQDRRGSAGVEKMLTTFVERALKLRADAQEQAGRGDHAAAVRTLEDSTKDYIRAIRSTGVYIPG